MGSLPQEEVTEVLAEIADGEELDFDAFKEMLTTNVEKKEEGGCLIM